ncbi:helix-turn-helix domain-containing protein [Vagococcus carniphilus]|uniref:helix-turn-helix domain-containing protein n=1 Tax=Vagococcus carniphilus TaxID=218144 RepID=UPI003B5C61D8
MSKIFVKDKMELKKSLMKKGYNIREFSDKCNVSNSYMSSIINGNTNLSAPLSKKISDELELKFSDIFFIQ